MVEYIAREEFQAFELYLYQKMDELSKMVTNELTHRPPVWATATISLLTFLLGSAVTFIAVLVK